MKRMKPDLSQGMLDLLILKIVALGPVHGYAIERRLEQISRGVVHIPQGSLYPALRRLETHGLLTAGWEKTATGREARFYSLTRKGRTRFKTEAGGWRRMTEAGNLILKLSGRGAK
ncbi:MAG TPA: PadR family transcriptional regulator [Blastocatellia bacterium]